MTGERLYTKVCEACGGECQTECDPTRHMCAACELGSLRFGPAVHPALGALLDRGFHPEMYHDDD